MDSTYPPEAWRRLGKALERRRAQLGYGFRQREDFLRDRGGPPPSVKTIGRIERGERPAYPESTITLLERMYGVEPGSFDAVLQGGELTPSPGSPGSPLSPGKSRTAQAAEPSRPDPAQAHPLSASYGDAAASRRALRDDKPSAEAAEKFPADPLKQQIWDLHASEEDRYDILRVIDAKRAGAREGPSTASEAS